MQTRKVDMLKDLSLKAFSEAASSEEAVPGGGSVSALAGCLAASLTAMVAALTRKKEKFRDVWTQMAEIHDKATALQQELLDAVDKDADSYRQVLAAFRLPKATDEEKNERSAAIQAAFKHAAEVPLEVAQAALGVIDLAGQAVREGNPDMITDAGVGVLMARSAALGALLNVDINLSSLKDQAVVEVLSEKAKRVQSDVLRKEAEILRMLEIFK